MSLGNINLITPPDKLFNLNITYLLVKPSNKVKSQFQQILSKCMEEINVYVFDDSETDIDWMMSVSQQADIIIVDIDNCDPTTKLFVSILLSQPNTHYLTSDELTPWGLISRNRIYNLDWIIDKINEAEDLDDSNDDEDNHDDA